MDTVLDLGRAYLITFGWAVVGAISMGVGVVIALKLFALATRSLDEWEEIRKGNLAVALILTGLIVAIGIVVATITRTQ